MDEKIALATDKAILKACQDNLAFIEFKIALCADLQELLIILDSVSALIIKPTDQSAIAECIGLLQKAELIAKKNSSISEGFNNIYLVLMQQVFNNYNASRLLAAKAEQ